MDLNAWPRDIRSYNAWAQMHGDQCPHGWSTFLPWHRMYLWEFEQALKDAGAPTVTLPYWDWTQSTREQIAGGYIPEAYRCWVTDEMLSALSGKVSAATLRALEAVEGRTFCSIAKFWAETKISDDAEQAKIVTQLKVVNPLFSEIRSPGEFATVASRSVSHALPDAGRTSTASSRSRPGATSAAEWTSTSRSASSTWSRTTRCTCGSAVRRARAVQLGLMANNLTAAFDPIFWAHHATSTVSGLSGKNGIRGSTRPIPSDVLPSVNSTVQDSLSIRKLGYEYRADTYVLPTEPSPQPGNVASPSAGVHGPVLANHRRAEVRLHARPAARAVVPSSACSSTSPRRATRPRSMMITTPGHFTLFGHGPCIGGPGHCEPRPQPRRRFDRRVPAPQRAVERPHSTSPTRCGS